VSDACQTTLHRGCIGVDSEQSSLFPNEVPQNCALLDQVGWWAGVPLSDREYSGALVRVVTGKGKLTGYAMTPKHLVEGGAGQEVMEIYVVKDKTGKYHQQVRFFYVFRISLLLHVC
jgi:hypothetical protein